MLDLRPVERAIRTLDSHPRFVLFPFSGGQIGGSHISSMFLANVLRDEHGYSCVFVCPDSTPLSQLAMERGHQVAPRPASANSLGEIMGGLRWRRSLTRMKDGGATIVHCNDFPTFSAWAPIAFLKRTPIVYHHRSLNQMTWKKRLVVRQAGHVVCISEATLENVAFIAPQRRTLILNPFPLAVSAERKMTARSRLLADTGLTDDVELIGFVGNFWRRKRPLMFIEIAARLARSRPTARFLIFGRAGDISQDEMLSRIRDSGLSERTRLVGFRLPPEDNVAALDLLLAPALDEPFGRTLVEAILCRTPYVAAEHAGHSEIGRRWGGGLLIRDTESINAFVAASMRALGDTRSLVLTDGQQERVVADLSPSSHARAVTAIYSGLVGSDPS